MTIDAAPTCSNCGRGRWTGDSFCGGCGTKYPFDPHEMSPELLDLGVATAGSADDNAESQDWNEQPQQPRIRRGLSIVLAGAAALALALVGLLVATRGNTPEAAVEPIEPVAPNESAERTPAATGSEDVDTADPVSTPPGSTLRDAPAVTDDLDVPALPGPTPALSATPIPLRELDDPAEADGSGLTNPDDRSQVPGNPIADLGLGSGWLATVVDSQPKAVDLATGEVVLLDIDVDPFGSILTPAGIYSPSSELLDQPSGQPFEQDWEFVAWDGSDPVPVDLPGFPIHAYIDPTVGPVAIVSTTGAAGTIADLIAVALESGEEQQIDVEVDLWLMQVGFRFAPLLQRTSSGFMIEVGPDIYRWSWGDGWRQITTGRAISVSGDNLIVSRCSEPSTCTLVLVGPDGTDVATLATDTMLSSILLSVVEIAPDRSTIAQIDEGSGLSRRPATSGIAMLDVESGIAKILADVPLSWAATWSPNSKFLLLTGTQTVTAVNAETGESTELDFFGRSSGTTPVIFLDTLDR